MEPLFTLDLTEEELEYIAWLLQQEEKAVMSDLQLETHNRLVKNLKAAKTDVR